jgi:phosphatidylglycerol lysyltransferase
VAWKDAEIAASYRSAGKPLTVALSRNPAFTLLDFAPRKGDPRAIILFWSGDGGWSGFEEQIGMTFQNSGYELIGVNSNDYAATDYDLATLQADTIRMAAKVEEPFGTHPRPIILGGWSMGAAQSIAAAGGPNPCPGLAGVLTLNPCSRGRYGLRLLDRTDILPTGPGTFGVAEFCTTMGRLHVVQWHSEGDIIDSRAWLKNLTAPHREFDFADTGHYYSSHRDKFLRELVASTAWILEPQPAQLSMTGSKK